MGFTFADTTTQVEIEGKAYTIDVGNSFIQDRLLEAANVAVAFDPSEAGEGATVAASEKLRGVIAAILGEEQAAEVFADRPPNLMHEVQLVLYLRQAMDESEPAKRFEATLAACDAVIGADD